MLKRADRSGGSRRGAGDVPVRSDFAVPDKPGENGETYVRPKQKAIIRFGKRMRDPVNRFFARQSLVGREPVVDAGLIDGLDLLQAQWAGLREEVLPLLAGREGIPPLGRISPDHRRIASTPAWKSFFFSGYGYHSAENRARCPQISSAIDAVPGLVVAFLSIMEPGTQVPLHRGLTKAWLNCHLPLVLPQDGGRCEIAIDGEIHRWREGEWLVFDETFPHQVWNLSSEPRLVLFLQVARPMTWPGRLAARAIYHAIRRSSFVGDVRKAVGA